MQRPVGNVFVSLEIGFLNIIDGLSNLGTFACYVESEGELKGWGGGGGGSREASGSERGYVDGVGWWELKGGGGRLGRGKCSTKFHLMYVNFERSYAFTCRSMEILKLIVF